MDNPLGVKFAKNNYFSVTFIHVFCTRKAVRYYKYLIYKKIRKNKYLGVPK